MEFIEPIRPCDDTVGNCTPSRIWCLRSVEDERPSFRTYPATSGAPGSIESAEQGSLVAEAQEFVAQLAKSGAEIGDPRERSQVRALMRFWSSFIYDRTGRFPEIELLPATAIASQREEELSRLEKDQTLGHTPVPMPSQEDSAQTEDNQVSFDAQADDAPVLIGPYQIVDQIGQGGFAIVYKAIDTANGRSVALKVLRKDRLTAPPEFRKRLMERERMALKLKHPHIIPVLSVAEYDDLPCIAMELVQGGSLADRLSTWYWRPKLGHILELMAQTAEGLAYLHEKGIVHRDIKPSNLLLSFDDHVYISDYTDLQEIESLYGGTIAGTPEYMAPEVILHPDSGTDEPICIPWALFCSSSCWVTLRFRHNRPLRYFICR